MFVYPRYVISASLIATLLSGTTALAEAGAVHGSASGEVEAFEKGGAAVGGGPAAGWETDGNGTAGNDRRVLKAQNTGNAGTNESSPRGRTAADTGYQDGQSPSTPPLAGQSEIGAPHQNALEEGSPATTGSSSETDHSVPARPCSTTAQETDGTTTCIGLPPRRR